MSIHIRPADLSDAPEIAAVHVRSTQVAYAGKSPDPNYLDTLSVEAWTERWQGILSSPESKTLVAEENGHILGFVSLGSNRDGLDDAGEVRLIYVDSNAWRRGIGTALMDAAEAQLAMRFGCAVLWVLEWNEPARQFYESRGWRLDGVTKQSLSIGLEEVRYCLQLDNSTRAI